LLFQSPPVTRSMKTPNDVPITREGDFARTEYKEEGIPVTHLEIGPEIARALRCGAACHSHLLIDDKHGKLVFEARGHAPGLGDR
jgi:hypothetical protein